MHKFFLIISLIAVSSFYCSKNTNKIIKGIWTDGSSENATFKITEDSIYYVDVFKSYKYEIKGDSMIIFFEDEKFCTKIELATKDSLVLSIDSKKHFYWKFTD